MFSFRPQAVAIAAAAVVSSAMVFSSAYAEPYKMLVDNFDYPTTKAYYTVYLKDVPNWHPEGERDKDDVGIIRYPNHPDGSVNGMLELRDYREDYTMDASATRLITLDAGLKNISITFSYLGHETDNKDFLYFQWRVEGGQWSDKDDAKYALSPVDKLQSATVNLANLVTTQPTTIEIIFWTDVTDPEKVCSRNGWSNCTWTKPSHGQAAKIDDIWLYAQKDACEPSRPCGNDAVPIPGALPLFLSGAAVFGGLVYRRRRKTDAAGKQDAA